MDQIWDMLIKMIPGLAGYVAGTQIDIQNRQNIVTPKDALAQTGRRREEYNTQLQGLLSGNQQNPALTQATQAASASLSRPVTPPRPFRGETTQGGNTELLMKILQQAQGGFQNPGINQGVSNLQSSLDSRFSRRPLQNRNQVTATR